MIAPDKVPRGMSEQAVNAPSERPLLEALPVGMALASVGSAAIHLSTAGEHAGLFRIAFLAMAVFQLAWAVAVVVRPGPVMFLIGVAGQGAIVATWLAAHTSGLPFGPGAGEPAATGLKDVAATVLELAVIGGALLLVSPRSAQRWRTALVPHGLGTVATVALTALTVAAVMTPHAGGVHAHGEAASGRSSQADDHHDDAASDNHHDVAMAGEAVPGHTARGEGHAPGMSGMGSGHGLGSSPGHTEPVPGGDHHSGSGQAGEGGHEGSEQGHGKAEHGAHVAAVGGPGPYLWRWEPAEVEISVGQMVEWVNRTDLEHHVTFYDGPIRKSLHLEADDGETSYVFREPGTYLYRCNITYHSEMFFGRCVGQCGSITVRN